MAAILGPSFLPIIEGLYWLPVIILASGLLLVSVIVLIAQKISDRKMNGKHDKGDNHKDK